MKKMGVILMLLVVCFCSAMLTGCAIDDEHAVVTMTTSDGRVVVAESYNGSNATCSGQTLAKEYACSVEILEGGSMTYVFKCDACGNEQSEEITEPAGRMLSCDCEEDTREYFCLKVVYPQNEAETEK